MAIKTVAVNPAKQMLADLRAQIDQVDGALFDLLVERARIIEQVREAKGKQHIYIRPGREVQMLRALLARPFAQELPEGLLVRLWQEMFGAFLTVEGGLKVGVYAPAKGPDLWDLTRDHFGAFVPMAEYSTAQAVIKALRERKITVAVVPPPQQGEKDCWWPLLSGDKENVLTVFHALPVEILKAGRRNARNAMPQGGLIVGKLYPELTGADRAFLGLQSIHVPEAEMKRLLGKAGYKVRDLIVKEGGASSSAPTSYLVEVDGFIGLNDTRLGRIKAMLGSRLKLLSPLGGYPVPLKSGRR